MNREEVRAAEFAQRREWADRFTSEKLREMLANGLLHSGEATAAREVLRSRNEDVPQPPSAGVRKVRFR